MAALSHRDYGGATDHAAALALWLRARAASGCDHWPPLDALEAELAAWPGGTASAQLWEDRHGALAGMALLLDECVLVWCTRAGAEDEALEDALIAWGLDRARSSGEHALLFVPVRRGDEHLAALLAREGFEEDSWHNVRMERSLREPIAAPEAPAGVSIRPIADSRELAAVTALHASLFASRQKTAGERAAIMRGPGYRPALDLIAALDDGTAAGYILGLCCALEAQRLGQALGWLEFVGVASAHRGRGIGRALTLHLLGAMRREGLDTVLLTTGAANDTARRLFEGCGFRTRHEIRWFVREAGGRYRQAPWGAADTG